MIAGWALFKRAAAVLWLPFCIICLLLGVWRLGVDMTEKRLNTAHALVLAERDAALFKAKADQLTQKLTMERKHGEDMAAVKNDFQRTNDEAQKRIAALDAAVRAGDVRLRKRFTCPAVPASGSAPAVASATRGNEAATPGLQNADVEFLVRLSDDADAVVRQLTACQAIVRKDRGL